MFYFAGTLLVSALVHGVLLAEGKGSEGKGPEGKGSRGGPKEFFRGGAKELWTGEVLGGLSSFVLTWTLFFGLVGG